jgi:hypothetical protein
LVGAAFKRPLIALALMLLASAFLPAPASADLPDPLASGPYGVNRAYYDAGVLQLTTNSIGVTAGTVSSCSPTDTGGGKLQYGQSTRCPDGTFPQPLEGTVTWPAGDANPYKVLLFLHGRHSACKTASGADGGSQSFGTGNCANGYWPSWEGYDYMSDLLASWGYTVISPSAGALVVYDNASSPMDSGAYARAEIIGNTLDLMYAWNTTPAPGDIGSSLIGKLDFSNVGIMGHSRGGEGVAEYIPYNRQRPAPARRYNLKAVFALAPIDRNKQTPTGTNFATLLPACDGDVTTIAGANMFERGKYANPVVNYAKLQYYTEGANHNYYNTRWVNSDRTGTDAACGVPGSTTPTSIRLSQADQRKNGLFTMPTFLRYYAGGETDLKPWITGEAGMAPSACPTGATHVPDCVDEMKTTYMAPASRRLDVLRPDSGVQPTTASPQAPDNAGGQYKGTGFARFDWCNPDPFSNPLTAQPPASQSTTALKACTGPTRGSSSANAAIQSWGPQLSLGWSSAATLSATLRGSSRDVSAYDTLNFSAGQQSNDTTLNPKLDLANFPAAAYTPRMTTQNFHIALVDRDGDEKSVKLTDFPNYPGGLESALGTTPNNSLHVVLNGFRLPLDMYAPYVDLSKLDRIEFRFGDTADVNPTGAIQFGALAFQQEPGYDPTTESVPLHQLASDPDLPNIDGVKTGAPRYRTKPGHCVDTSKPKLAIGTLRLKGGTLKVAGTAKDNGCAASKGKKGTPGLLNRIQVTIGLKSGDDCRFLTGAGALTDTVTCEVPLSLVASGHKKWKLKEPADLPKGSYIVQATAIDKAGNLSKHRTLRLKVKS